MVTVIIILSIYSIFADRQITLTLTPNLGNLYVDFNKTLTLNCSISQPTYGLLPEQLIWQHNNSWKPNVTYVLNNRTVQLRMNYVHDDDAGLYRCAVFYNASKFIHSHEIRVLVGGMQIHNNQHFIFNDLKQFCFCLNHLLLFIWILLHA